MNIKKCLKLEVPRVPKVGSLPAAGRCLKFIRNEKILCYGK